MIIYNSLNTITTNYKVDLNPEPKTNAKIKHTIGNKVIKQFDRTYYNYSTELRLDHTDYNTLIDILDDDLPIYITPDYLLPGTTSISDIEVIIEHKINQVVSGLAYYIDVKFSEVLQN